MDDLLGLRAEFYAAEYDSRFIEAYNRVTNGDSDTRERAIKAQQKRDRAWAALVNAMKEEAWDECYEDCYEQIVEGLNPANRNPYSGSGK